MFRPSAGFRLICGLLLAVSALGLSSCHSNAYYYYKFPEYNFAGRPVPPSKLAQRVMIGVTFNGSSGSLQIVDASRDIRSNVEDTIPGFQISGYSSGYPGTILNFPAELRGFVYSNSDGSLININYSTEASAGSVGTFQSGSNAVSVPPIFTRYYGAEEGAGVLEIIDNEFGSSYGLNIPNVYKVVANKGDTVALAMVRNSNVLYRIFRLNQGQYTSNVAAIAATGSADCEPNLLPVYCAVSVPGTYDRPYGVYFSLDGTTAYVLNCGPECGGTTASVTLLQQGPLNICVQASGWLPNHAYALNTAILDPAGHIQKVTTAGTSGTVIPTFNDAGGTTPDGPGSLVWTDQGAATTTPCTYVSSSNPVIANVPVPGGVTAAISDGTTLYLAGQQLQQPDGMFAGNLSLLNQATNTITNVYSISDGTHSKMLFADNNTLWIGSQYCATGERARQASLGVITQSGNYGCLTRFVPGSGAILPAWAAGTAYTVGQQVTDGTNTEVAQQAGTSGGTTPAWSASIDGTTKDNGVVWVDIGPTTRAQVIPSVTPNSTALPVLYPNQNDNLIYYGSLTGLCWVQNFEKVYTAYGGQVHIFSTIDGSEIDNEFVAVQGTALDVAYMDALTDDAD